VSDPRPPDLIRAAAGGDDFRTLFEFLPIGAYRSTPDGRLLRANPALVHLNGCENEAELIARVRDIALEWYLEPGRRDQFRRVLENEGQVRGFTSEIRRYRTRERIWVSENAHIVRDAAGQPLYYEGTVEEVTDRMQWAFALHRSEEQLRQIANHVPGMVYRVHMRPDGAARYSFVGEGIRALYGVSPQELIDNPLALRRYRHPADVERVDRQVRAAFEARAPLSVEYRIVLGDGAIKWLQMSSSVTETVGDEQTRVGVLLDVTAQREAQALRAERDQAESAQRAMTQFLSRVSHELRTPLNAILGFAQLIDTDPQTVTHQQPWVREMLASGQHLLTIVEDILDLSGAQSGQMQIDVVDVVLADVVAECRAMLEPQAAAQRLQVSLAIDPAIALRADRKRVKQIVANLLSNAVKYNRPAGQVDLRARRVLGADGPAVELAVSDTGTGLGAEQLERLFTPFDRLGAQHRDVAGTGLGLSLSRHLARAMGGEIRVESRLDVGSTFVLSLPAAAG
jgi:PAS domain S-box-containing protein